ncbi:MAG: ERF family protein [Gammaproteobacteria bacterium]
MKEFGEPAGLIYSAMVAALQGFRAVAKKQMPQYLARSIDDVFNAANEQFAEHGIFVLPEVLRKQSEEVTFKSGGHGHRVTVDAKFTFCASDGSCVSAVFPGEATDTQDKATTQAMQIAFKYCLIQVFCLKTWDLIDPDKLGDDVGAGLPDDLAMTLKGLAERHPDERGGDSEVTLKEWLDENLEKLTPEQAKGIIAGFKKKGLE